MNDIEFSIKKTLQEVVGTKKMTVSFQKVWSVERISRNYREVWYKKPALIIIALLLFAAPVSATVIYKWYSIEFSQTEVVPPASEKSWMPLSDYIVMLKSEKTLPLQESEKKAGITFLRSTWNNLPLELSGGVEWGVKGGVNFFDIYHKENNWIVAYQYNSHNVAKLIQDKVNFKVQLNKNEGILPLNDKNRVAIYEDLGNQEFRIRMLVKKEHEVLFLDVRGNVPKEELVSLISSYN